ncbi:MAG: AAA family ATPase [Desulfobulbaceae bacterium]|nr:AAA family ATPase [Desulfobulbaceae bacterium]
MIVTVGNTKGGVGKTTIAVNLAVEAAKDGKTVLLIDTDPQGSSTAFRTEREKDDIKAVALVSDKLHKDIQGFVSAFNFIIIDAGGRDNAVFRSAVAACNLFLLPVLPSQFDVWAAEDAVKVFKEIQPFNKMKGRMVLNMVRPNTKVSVEAQEALSEYQDDLPMLEERLHNRVAFKSSISDGQGVNEYEPSGKAADEIKRLYKAIKKFN